MGLDITAILPYLRITYGIVGWSALALAATLLLFPEKLKKANKILNKWISTRKGIRWIEVYIDFDKWLLSNRKGASLVFLGVAILALIVFYIIL